VVLSMCPKNSSMSRRIGEGNEEIDTFLRRGLVLGNLKYRTYRNQSDGETLTTLPDGPGHAYNGEVARAGR
jgi:hypothetical protein